MIKKIILFALLATGVYAQQRITVYGDTLMLKKSTESGIVLLLQYGSGNPSGGGFFMRIDSAYAEGTYAFDCTNMPTYQWARLGYPNSYFLTTTTATGTVTALTSTTAGITTANITTLNATTLNT